MVRYTHSCCKSFEDFDYNLYIRERIDVLKGIETTATKKLKSCNELYKTCRVFHTYISYTTSADKRQIFQK